MAKGDLKIKINRAHQITSNHHPPAAATKKYLSEKNNDGPSKCVPQRHRDKKQKKTQKKLMDSHFCVLVHASSFLYMRRWSGSAPFRSP
jgi:hypothetical protein